MKFLMCLFCYIQWFLVSNNDHVLIIVTCNCSYIIRSMMIIMLTAVLLWYSNTLVIAGHSRTRSQALVQIRSQSYQAFSTKTCLPFIWEKAPCHDESVLVTMNVSQRLCLRNMVAFVFSSLIEKQSTANQQLWLWDIHFCHQPPFTTCHFFRWSGFLPSSCGIAGTPSPFVSWCEFDMRLLYCLSTDWIHARSLCEIHENCARMSCLNTAQRLGTALMTSHTTEGHCEFHRFGFETKFTGESLPWSMFVSSLLTTLYLL